MDQAAFDKLAPWQHMRIAQTLLDEGTRSEDEYIVAAKWHIAQALKKS